MTDEAPKKLKDLNVNDLRTELERRGIATNGPKVAIVARLRKRLEEEGHEPNEYAFSPNKVEEEMEDQTAEDKSPVECQDQEEPENSVEIPELGEDAVTLDENGDKGESEAQVSIAEEGTVVEVVLAAVTDNKKLPEPGENNAAEVTEAILTTEMEARMIPGLNQVPVTDDQADNDTEMPKASAETAACDGNHDNLHQEEDTINLMIGEEDVNFDDFQGEAARKPEAAESSDKKQGSTGTAESILPEQPKVDKNDEDEEKRGRNLWISGLASTTRATDLKTLFSTHGKVLGAKVVTNSRTPGARCYGFVTMETKEDAAKCIESLHKSELHGRSITVEIAPGSGAKKVRGTTVALPNPIVDGTKPVEKVSTDQGHASSKSTSRTDRHHSREAERSSYSRSTTSSRYPAARERPVVDRRPPQAKRKSISPVREDKSSRPGVLTFAQIKDQQAKFREREEERWRREKERRRLQEEERHIQDMERRRVMEEEALERERDELRREREKLEREKQELMRFERERQRLERERLLREKEEVEQLRRQQQARLEELRRSNAAAIGGGGIKRAMEEQDPYYNERKRSGTSPDMYRSSGGGGGMSAYEKQRYVGGGDSRQSGYPDRSRSSTMSVAEAGGGYGQSRHEEGDYDRRGQGYSGTTSGGYVGNDSRYARQPGGSWNAAGSSQAAYSTESTPWGRGDGRAGSSSMGRGFSSQLGNDDVFSSLGQSSSFRGMPNIANYTSHKSYSSSDRFDAYKNPMLNK